MTIRKVKAHEAVCGDCHHIQVATDPLDIVGFSGTVVQQHDGAGTGTVHWFACSEPCIRLAITNAIAEVYEK